MLYFGNIVVMGAVMQRIRRLKSTTAKTLLHPSFIYSAN